MKFVWLGGGLSVKLTGSPAHGPPEDPPSQGWHTSASSPGWNAPAPFADETQNRPCGDSSERTYAGNYAACALEVETQAACKGVTHLAASRACPTAFRSDSPTEATPVCVCNLRCSGKWIFSAHTKTEQSAVFVPCRRA